MVVHCTFRPDCYWWFGQSKRTCESGQFPRNLVDPQRKITSVSFLFVYLSMWSVDVGLVACIYVLHFVLHIFTIRPVETCITKNGE